MQLKVTLNTCLMPPFLKCYRNMSFSTQNKLLKEEGRKGGRMERRKEKKERKRKKETKKERKERKRKTDRKGYGTQETGYLIQKR